MSLSPNPGKENDMRSYSHAYDIAFELISHEPDGSDVTPAMLRAALMRRMADLDANNEWREAVGAPYDTHECKHRDSGRGICIDCGEPI